jgi:outer membrane protein TolC
MKSRPACAAGAALLLVGLFQSSAALARTLSLGEAEQLALQSSPALKAARIRLGAGRQGLRSTRGHLLAAVRVSDEYQHYDSPFAFPLALPGGGPPLVVRDQDINTFVASANQPLLSLVRGVEEYRGQQQNLAASESQLRVAQEQTRTQVRLAFLRYFEAVALADIARSSQRELGEQLTVAEAKLKAGVLTNADVLRLQVAVANAQQQEIVAKTQGEVARSSLLIVCGLPAGDASIELTEPGELLQAAQQALPAYASASEQSLGRRPELVAGKHLAQLAYRQRRARMFALLPDVDLEASFVHLDGQLLGPANSIYVGVKAQWAVWEWGATYYTYKSATALAEAALLDLEAQRRQILSEVATDLAQTAASQSAVQLAQKSIASAEEAYRVTVALVKAGSATTTDLLDSQSALNQARLSLTRAQYQQAIAHVQLTHTMGGQ